METMTRISFLPLALLLAPAPLAAQARWSVEAFGGTALSLRTPLTIRQRGQADVRLTARWSTRPLRDAPYYAYRVERWSGDTAWSLELLHHKLYLENPPPEVGHFEVSHGYNLLTLSRVWARGAWDVRAGAGAVVAHAESKVRGREHASGYRLSGAAAQLGLGRRLPLGRHLSVVAEGKATGAWARVPVADGSAEVPNAAVHALVGAGWRF
ncbi:MAG TPA: hypothetical protein VF541_10930 [Longimicrobium sp.]